LIELAVGRFPFCNYESESLSASSLLSGFVDDYDDEEEDDDEDTEDDGTDEEEEEDPDDEAESVCGDVRSAGSSLLTVKPS
jgi:hypothetical protein